VGGSGFLRNISIVSRRNSSSLRIFASIDSIPMARCCGVIFRLALNVWPAAPLQYNEMAVARSPGREAFENSARGDTIGDFVNDGTSWVL
jgi:hypothetical protein